MNSLAKKWGQYYTNGRCSGRGSVRIECTVRVREVGGSNPPAPTENKPLKIGFLFNDSFVISEMRFEDPALIKIPEHQFFRASPRECFSRQHADQFRIQRCAAQMFRFRSDRVEDADEG